MHSLASARRLSSAEAGISTVQVSTSTSVGWSAAKMEPGSLTLLHVR